MKLKLFIASLALAACSQQPGSTQTESVSAQLEAPGPESEPSRVFAPLNDAARAATGELSVATSLRLPDASQSGADALEVLTLHGGNGLVVEAQVTSVVSPATEVQGQTLRALLDLPVEEPQVLVYRVANETKPANGPGLCGASVTAFVVVWEPSTPGDASYKVLGVTGAAPGAGDARACTMLEYRRG
jgi:hypothetical protein